MGRRNGELLGGGQIYKTTEETPAGHLENAIQACGGGGHDTLQQRF